MSIESRLKRGDNPDDVAEIFNIDPEDMKELVKKYGPKKQVKKKAAKPKK